MIKQQENTYQTRYKLFSFTFFGLTIFLLNMLILKLDLLYSLILSTVAIGALIYIAREKTQKEIKVQDKDENQTADITSLTKEIKQNLKNVTIAMLQIKNRKVNLRLGESTQRIKEILNEIEQVSADVKVARRFIIVFIAGLEKHILAYIESTKGEIQPNTLQKLYSSIDLLEERFDEEFKKHKKR